MNADTYTPNICSLILVAGLSTRMGTPKMILPWGTSTVIAQVVRNHLAAGVQSVTVVTGAVRDQVMSALTGLPVQEVFNPSFEDGEMLHSVQIGLRSLPSAYNACLLALGDQPQILPEVIASVIEAYRRSAAHLIVPSYQMRRAHPWLIHRALWDEILQLTPPHTLRSFLASHQEEIQYVNVDSPEILLDMDTPEDYQRFHRGS